MKTKRPLVLLLTLLLNAKVASVQPLPQYYMLDPKGYDPEVDVNTDLFLNNWRNSSPTTLHGDLMIHDIFISLKGDTLKPAEKGVVLTLLKRVNRFSVTAGSTSGAITPRD